MLINNQAFFALNSNIKNQVFNLDLRSYYLQYFKVYLQLLNVQSELSMDVSLTGEPQENEDYYVSIDKIN